MTSSVVIRRCVLRIRRLGGWSWGPDPDALLAAATRALPRLVAGRVRNLDAVRAGTAAHIAAPLRIRVTATLDELARLAAAARTGQTGDAAPILDRIDRELARVVAPVMATPALAEGTADATEAEAGRTPIAEGAAPARATAAALLALLVAWARDDVVAEIASALPATVTAAWLAQIAAAAQGATPRTASPGLEGALAAARQAIARLAAIPDPGVRRLVAVAAAAAACDAPLALDVIAGALALVPWELAAHAAPAREPTPARAAHAVPGRAAVEPASATAARTPREPISGGPAPAPRRATVAAPALPFLALVPLARCGWLAALPAILEAADAADTAPAIAAAIAYKLMPPPELGWRRRPEHRAGAEALAGRELDDAELHAASARLAPLVRGLAAPLTAELRRGHRPGAPVLLAPDGDDVALIDPEGLFVIARDRDPAVALAAARALGELVLVSAELATSALLDRIEVSNLVFVTDASPARGQPWRAVPGGRLWTNDGGELARHRALAEPLGDASALAAELLAALRTRPAVPRAACDALDRIATQAVALALGDLAWQLFRDREPATPVLALERFATLDATITTTAERIDVRIPIGRRHADLLAHGYLTAIPDVPWLGRVVHISGG